VLEAVEAVLRRAERGPADAALREVMRDSPMSPELKALVASAVFTHFRWFGWLDAQAPLRARLEQAFDLAEAFAANASAISDADLVARVVPPWAHEVIRVTAPLAREWQREPRRWLRARPGLRPGLPEASVKAHRSVPDAWWHQGMEDLFRADAFHRGEFEIQDLSSQLVGHLCAPQAGETWWDACAGEGGKTLHLCDLMGSKGLVWATDKAEWRLKLLKRRAARAKIFNYRAKIWPRLETLPTRAKFDGVLVDAPCSGMGTWGRNPHARWTTRPQDVAELSELQAKMLDRVADAVKPGGKLVYSVCTLAAPETTGVADLFALKHPEFAPLELATPLNPRERAARFELQPQELHANGMFIAAWHKSG